MEGCSTGVVLSNCLLFNKKFLCRYPLYIYIHLCCYDGVLSLVHKQEVLLLDHLYPPLKHFYPGGRGLFQCKPPPPPPPPLKGQ